MFYFLTFLSIVFIAIALRWYDNPKTVVQFLGLIMLEVFSFGVAVGTVNLFYVEDDEFMEFLREELKLLKQNDVYKRSVKNE